MSDPIHSSSWTGEIDRASTFKPVTPSELANYRRILAARERWDALPPEVKRLKRLAAWLLVAPVALWIAHIVAGFAIQDGFQRDHSGLLWLWAFLAFGLAWLQLRSKSQHMIALRQLMFGAALIATVGAASLYDYAAIMSHARAKGSAAERTFEIYRCRHLGRYCAPYTLHQRADGSTVEGESVGPPLQYGSTCATVQRLAGDYGFSWLRVLERSPPQREVQWPIRREDCFSDKPIASLKR
jgi:hypothetical protein